MMPPQHHIVHVVFRLDFGGLENGLVNLINSLPASHFTHSVIALTEATAFAKRIRRPDVRVYQLNKRPGKDLAVYWRLFKLLKAISPDTVHTRNLGTLDCQAVAWLAGVRHRIHGEHGWDVADPDGRNPKSRRMRRLFAPLVHRWVALSQELESWLTQRVGITPEQVVRICNGVDTGYYRPPSDTRGAGVIEFGTITRFSEIKDPLNTLEAFAELCRQHPGDAPARLTMVGDGPLCRQARLRAEEIGVADKVYFAGSQLDVLPWLRKFDVFVLGSRREGISNTVLEAMAAGLPVIATNTGGTPELVDPDVTGALVPPADSKALAAAMMNYLKDPHRIKCHGAAARQRAVERFSLDAMVAAYQALYMQRDPIAVCAE